MTEMNDQSSDSSQAPQHAKTSTDVDILDHQSTTTSSDEESPDTHSGTKDHYSFKNYVKDGTVSPRFRPFIRIARIILYPVIFCAMCVIAIYGSEWGVTTGATAPIQSLRDFFDPLYTSALYANGSIVLNMLLWALFFLILIAITNRFWVSLGLIGTLAFVWMTANRLKVTLRHEPVLPTDLQIAGNGQAGNIGSFIPPEYRPLIWKTVILIVMMWICAVLVRLLLGKGRLVHFHNTGIHIGTRIIVAAIPILVLVLFTANLPNTGSVAYRFAQSLGDKPALWDTIQDAQQNGPIVSYLRFSRTTAVTKPENYSEATMKRIEKKYSAAARTINAHRSTKMTNSTVIGVLSESFSDPTRVPGIRLDGGDPMPRIRALKSQTTSGLMLSSGYGGGTANLEYQELTGLSTTTFNSSAISPYLQLVPHQKIAFSFNQMWNIADDGSAIPAKTEAGKESLGSIAIHPYYSGMYQRRTNFIQKFLFRYFYTLDGPQYMKHTQRLDRSFYASDQQSYQEVIDRLSADHSNKQLFIQLTTMQNHLPFVGQWNNNQFNASSTTSKKLSDTEATAIKTAAKGFSITDQATADWLSQLDKMKRPITVVWYGDHLPGIYDDAMDNPANMITLHETDYFIWSNAAARAQGAATKLPAADTAYTSPNYLMTLAAEQMNAQVSPYMAFLTRMHEQIPAMEPALATADWSANPDTSSETYLDGNGKKINPNNMTAAQKQMLAEYHDIAYDMTLGNHYLEKAGFTRLPR